MYLVQATPEALRRAVHEAGHAVFAYHCCIPIREVWIEPDEKKDGIIGGVAHDQFMDPSCDARFVYAALCYAGRFAELTFLGVVPDTHGSNVDLREMATLYGYDLDASDDECDKGIEAIMKIIDAVSPMVTDVLTCRKAAVIRLARALVKKNRLAGAEVTRIIHRHRNRRDRNRVPRSVWAPRD
jgi:ATP-dependent Zn protease